MGVWRLLVGAVVVTVGCVGGGVVATGVPVASEGSVVVSEPPVGVAGAAVRVLHVMRPEVRAAPVPFVVVEGTVFVPEPVVKPKAKARTRPVRKVPVGPVLLPGFEFTLASFNILGSQHTAGGGDKRGFASGVARARWAVDVLRNQNISVVGFQEIQRDQLRTVLAVGGGEFDSFPKPDGDGLAVPTAIVWRTAEWSLVYGSGFVIPFIDQQRPQGFVVLEHRGSGQRVAVLNAHLAPRRDNRDAEGERDAGTAVMLDVVRSLVPTGLPVFLVGDMNEKTEVFCDTTNGTSLVSASGGSNDDGGGCRPPGRVRIDWIFGSPGVVWSGFRYEDGPGVRRVTDHSVPVVRVGVPALPVSSFVVPVG